MKKTMRKIIIYMLLACLLLPVLLTACGSKNHNQITSLKDLSGRTLSVQNGTVFAVQVKEHEDLKDCDLIYGQTTGDALAILLGGKSDACIMDSIVAKSILKKENVLIIDESVADSAYAIALPKESQYRDSINGVLAEMDNDGVLEELSDKWFSGSDSKAIPDELWTPIADADGTFTCLENSELDNVCYRDEAGKLQGFDVEMMLMIAHKLNYNIEFVEMEFNDIITELAIGAGDMGISGIDLTSERQRYVDFSDTYLDVGTVAVVRDESKGSFGSGLFYSAKNSVKRVVTEENRWKEIFRGFLMTILLSLGSIVVGTVLGFALFFMDYFGDKIRKKIVDIIYRFVTLLPVSVRMMLWFYIILAKASGKMNFLAGLLALSVGFGVSLFATLADSVDALEDDYRIVGRAMGFSKYQTLKKIVLPQALPIIAVQIEPLFIGQIKDTTLVGFIAVQDLQYVLDGIRSRTEEFAAPILISVAVYLIYEELVCLLIKKAIEKAKGRREVRNRNYYGV